MHSLAVTTTSKFDEAERAAALALAQRWSLPYIERKWKAPLEPLLERTAHAFLVVGSNGVTLWDKEGSLRFTPGMAQLRVMRLEQGAEDDILVRLSELRPKDHFLDGTLGLAADALVAARRVGPEGRVVGLEKSLPLCAVVSEGLKAFDIGAASCRIEVMHADTAEYLRECASRSFDVVFLDPMFGVPKRASPPFEALRRHADHAPLTPQMLEDARRVARRWVVIKAARYSQDLKRLGLTPEPASRTATVVWARVPGAPF